MVRPAAHTRNMQRGPASSSSWLRFFALILRILVWPLRPLLALLFPSSELDGLTPAVTAKAAQSFSNYISQFLPTALGDTPWATSGYNECKAQATRNQSLFCIYLHSPLHRDADKVSQQLLCNPQVLTQLEQPQMLNLGLDIHTAQGAQLAQMLNACAYPLFAVLQPPPTRGSSPMQMLMRIEGPALVQTTPQSLASNLSSVLTRHQTYLADQEARRLQREQESLLRRQQDEEYQAALLADQERQRQQDAERERAERELREERERKEALANAHQNRLSNSQRLLSENSVTTSTPSVTRIRFVLSSGKKLEHKFPSPCKIEVLRAFLTVNFHETGAEQMPNIGLSTSFPKRTYNDDSDNEMTLQEAGLSPQAVLMVQNLDA